MALSDRSLSHIPGDPAPEIKDYSFLGDLISDSVDCHLLVAVIVQRSRDLSRNDDDIAIIPSPRLFDIDNTRMFRYTFLWLHHNIGTYLGQLLALAWQ